MTEPLHGLPLSTLVSELAKVGARVTGDGGVMVKDVRHDSRHVEPGDLFVGILGTHFDGARFSTEAVRRGAVAVLAEHRAPLPELSVPVVRVDDAKVALGLASECVHGHPTERLATTGITGTNGKTTTAWLAAEAIDAAGGAAARLGTLGFAFRDDVIDESLTTPEADDVSRFAVRALERGATHLAMEVSSIALTERRVDAVSFAVAAYTNLTQDHLDFHGSMEAYAAAKARLFTEMNPRASVILVDDPFGAELARRANGRVITVSREPRADVFPRDVRIDASGIHSTIRLPSRDVLLESRLFGAHNLDNLLVALGIVEALGLDVARAAEGLSRAVPVPGRLERCDEPGDDVTVLVDYAHTEDALSRVLLAVRALSPGEVHCVFGCGGDRDPTKRPKMGAAVGRGADRATLTNDNPRSEDPAAIARAIEPELAASGIKYEVVLDRGAAIERAIVSAAPGDLVLLAGKGHEPYQIVGTEKRDFDDRVEARRALALRRRGTGRGRRP